MEELARAKAAPASVRILTLRISAAALSGPLVLSLLLASPELSSEGGC